MTRVPEEKYIDPDWPEARKNFIRRQITPEVASVLAKINAGDLPNGAERDFSINQSEAGAILSLLSGRPIPPEYVKELYRTKGAGGKELTPRIHTLKPVGHSLLFRLGEVYDVGPIAVKGMRTKRPSYERLLEELESRGGIKGVADFYGVVPITVERWLRHYGHRGEIG
jgi:hypothetical protein